MAKKYRKEPILDRLLKECLGHDRNDIEKDICVNCSGPAKKFKDKISEREYRISGLCQKCQDFAFSPPPPEE